jgi:tRNA dimethylallyltransferase
MSETVKIIVITGPTATGKTALAVKLARNFNGEIISADSRQVYQGMDLGTGKDLDEYTVDGTPVPYHLINIADPACEYNLREFCKDTWQALENIHSAGHLPFICGGSALYLDAILAGYDLPGAPPDKVFRDELDSKSKQELLEMLKNANPQLFAEFKDTDNRKRILRALEKAKNLERKLDVSRITIEPLILGVYFPRKIVHKRIEERLDKRLQHGMIDEVEQLHTQGVTWERLEFFGLEYRYIAEYLQGKTSYDEMRYTLLTKIRQFAKRQDIWFRKMEREGRDIHWIPEGNCDRATKLVKDFLSGQPLPEPEIRIKDIDYGKQ